MSTLRIIGFILLYLSIGFGVWIIMAMTKFFDDGEDAGIFFFTDLTLWPIIVPIIVIDITFVLITEAGEILFNRISKKLQNGRSSECD